jgi:two-component system chemotaxis response regulator CheB
MPQRHVNVDYCVPLDQIAPLLIELTGRLVTTPTLPIPRGLEAEARIDRQESPINAGLEQIGELSRFTCPDCHGVLLQIADDDRVRFRCHVGHGYSVHTLLTSYSEQIERSLWTAIRSLEETTLFLDELTRHANVASVVGDSNQFASRAAEARKDSAALRELVNSRGALVAISDEH